MILLNQSNLSIVMTTVSVERLDKKKSSLLGEKHSRTVVNFGLLFSSFHICPLLKGSLFLKVL